MSSLTVSEYGYGLTPEIVELAARQAPNLIVTVDNGISSVERGVRTAKDKGIRVLITDHHLPGKELPAADAIVNPNQSECAFPSKCLAGVGVAFYVMAALRSHLRGNGWFGRQNIAEPNLAHLLDLVALGTVADLVPLDHNNRILVTQGLMRMQAGKTCAGIRALATVSGQSVVPAIEEAPGDLGFCIAPRLNAAGRLEDMSLGIECLLTDDETAAAQMAARLDELNRERRAIEAEMQQQAMTAIESLLRLDGASLPRGLCMYDENWHQGVIGLVASRLKEKFHRPVIAFARGNGDQLKSWRVLSRACISVTRSIILRLNIRGCLPVSAAMRWRPAPPLPEKNFAAFRDAFENVVGRLVTDDDLDEGRILTDGELAEIDMTVELAQLLRDSGPWGQGFPADIQ